MRDLWAAWQDVDRARPVHRVVIPVLLLLLFIAAGMDCPA